jgi:hypothetical protein
MVLEMPYRQFVPGSSNRGVRAALSTICSTVIERERTPWAR